MIKNEEKTKIFLKKQEKQNKKTGEKTRRKKKGKRALRGGTPETDPKIDLLHKNCQEMS